ncbi:MAG: PAS domain-containing protein [Alphaproteobacteria bacterium]|nr:PAS domain-containing protein [Alphaproteobacteria bacterium]
MTRADSALSFREPQLVRFCAHWRSVAGADRLPARGRFTARLLKPYLRNLAVLEITPQAARRFIHRNVGTAITERFGELTGRAFEDFLSPEIASRTTEFLAASVEARAPIRVVTQFWQREHLLAEIFAGPLADDGIIPDRLLLVSYFSGITNDTLRGDLGH